MRNTRLCEGGVNVLQTIRAKRAQADAKGIKLIDLSIGEPKGPALLSAREAAAAAVLSDAEAMHAYQYNDSPGVPHFSRRFIHAHLRCHLPKAEVDYLPIPGIKPILGLVPLACGCADESIMVATTTNPGYPIPADWCHYHPFVNHYTLPLTVRNQFRFQPDEIEPETDLIMMNYPHNPSGQVATREWLSQLCQFCSEHNIRLFNDAAYCILSYTSESCVLSEVAPEFPELSWAEAFTAAKLIGNGTGWHVGAVVGSPDFVGDLKIVKGKTDTGFVAPMAAGVIAAFENDQAGIAAYREMYGSRLHRLIRLLSKHGMQLAIKPAAGFFTLWHVPTYAFGKAIENAEQFNMMMIEQVGVVGVHFPGYIRYAVCGDIEAMMEDLRIAFEKAAVAYVKA